MSRSPPPHPRRQQTFSASCSNRRSWKHWSSCSLRTCQAWWRCCRVECSLSSSWVIRGTRPWVSALHIPPLLLLLLPLPPLLLLPPPLRLEKDSLLCIRCSNLKVEQSVASFCGVARRLHHRCCNKQIFSSFSTHLFASGSVLCLLTSVPQCPAPQSGL